MMRSLTSALTIFLLLSQSVLLGGCANRTKILLDGERAFLLSVSGSQVKILEENEKKEKVEVQDPRFLDGSYIFLPGQVKRIGDRLDDCYKLCESKGALQP